MFCIFVLGADFFFPLFRKERISGSLDPNTFNCGIANYHTHRIEWKFYLTRNDCSHAIYPCLVHHNYIRFIRSVKMHLNAVHLSLFRYMVSSNIFLIVYMESAGCSFLFNQSTNVIKICISFERYHFSGSWHAIDNERMPVHIHHITSHSI